MVESAVVQDPLTLYRPTGRAEFDLIAASGFRRFPPRLPEQPIFYPVLDRAYAEQIARDWNAPDPSCGHVGYVLRFAVERPWVDRYAVRRVGDATANELWVPSTELEALNDAIVGRIAVVTVFRGGVPGQPAAASVRGRVR